MIAPDEIDALIKRLQASDTTVFECKWPGGSLHLQFFRESIDAGDADPIIDTIIAPKGWSAAAVLKSPGIGYLRFRHPLERRELLREGDRIEEAQLVAYLQIDDVLMPVYAGREGVLTRFLVTEDSLVGYGAPLLEIN